MNHDTTLTIAARTALRVLAVMALAFGVLLALPGCGGGDFDEEDARATVNPPTCTTQPEVCW